MKYNVAYSSSYFLGLITVGFVFFYTKNNLYFCFLATLVSGMLFYKLECFRLKPNYLKLRSNRFIYVTVQCLVVYLVDLCFEYHYWGENFAAPMIAIIVVSIIGLVAMMAVGQHNNMVDEYLD